MKKRFYLAGLLVLGFMFSSAVVKAAVPGIVTNPRDTTVCAGPTASFIITDSNAVSRKWIVSTDGGTTWSLVAASATYSGVASDTLKVVTRYALNGFKYKGIVINGSVSDTSTAAKLTVDSSNAAITGPTAVCVGATIALHDAVTGGVWTSLYPDTATIDASTGTVAGVRAGVDTIIYVGTNTCGTYTDTLGLVVNPLPAISPIFGAGIVCQSSSITLSDAVSGGIWSSAHTSIATVNAATGVVTGVAAGFDTVSYTTTNGSCSSRTMHSVRVDVTATVQPITGPAATCIGNTINLMDANVLGTGTWSSTAHASVSTTGAVTGVSAGNATITYVFTNACNTVTATTTVSVQAPLAPGTISGPAEVCNGSFITLTETATGGMWISNNTGIANIDPSGNVTGVSQGGTIISYYQSNACGASVATYSVTVSDAAGPITGGDSVGVGHTLALSNIATGGAWSNVNTGVAGIDTATGLVFGVAPGIDTITYTVTNVCGTSSATLTLYVGMNSNAGVITGLDTVCIGSTITLSDSIAGGVWTASNGFATVDASGVVTGVSTSRNMYTHAATGIDTVYYTVTNAFGSFRISKKVFVNSAPIVTITGPNIIALGGNYFFTGLPAGGTFTHSNTHTGAFVSFGTEILSSGTDSVMTVATGSYVVLNSGKDTITYHVSNSCGNTDSIFVVSLTLTSVNAVANVAATLSVYPNPNQGEFTINLASVNNEDATVTITNIVGEKVKELKMSANQPATISLDQPAGMYFINVATATGRYSTKITVKK